MRSGNCYGMVSTSTSKIRLDMTTCRNSLLHRKSEYHHASLTSILGASKRYVDWCKPVLRDTRAAMGAYRAILPGDVRWEVWSVFMVRRWSILIVILFYEDSAAYWVNGRKTAWAHRSIISWSLRRRRLNRVLLKKQVCPLKVFP